MIKNFHAISKRVAVACLIACSMRAAPCPAQTSTLTPQAQTEAKPERVLKNAGWVGAVAFSPDSTLLASSGMPFGDVQIWNVHSGTVQRAISIKLHDKNIPIVALAFSPDGKTLVAAGGWHLGIGGVGLWDVASGKFQRWLLDPATSKHWANDVCYSPDGKLIAACIWMYGPKAPHKISDLLLGPQDYPVVGEISVWDARSGKLMRRLDRTGQPRSVSFAPDNRTLVFCEDTALLWDTQTGKLLRHLTEATPQEYAGVDKAKFAPDGQTIAGCASFSDVAVRLWNARTGQLRHVLPVPEVKRQDNPKVSKIYGIQAIAFSCDGKILAGGEDQDDAAVRLWDATTGKLLQVLHGHTESITALAFTPDGTLLASGGLDEKIYLWRLKP